MEVAALIASPMVAAAKFADRSSFITLSKFRKAAAIIPPISRHCVLNTTSCDTQLSQFRANAKIANAIVSDTTFANQMRLTRSFPNVSALTLCLPQPRLQYSTAKRSATLCALSNGFWRLVRVFAPRCPLPLGNPSHLSELAQELVKNRAQLFAAVGETSKSVESA